MMGPDGFVDDVDIDGTRRRRGYISIMTKIDDTIVDSMQRNKKRSTVNMKRTKMKMTKMMKTIVVAMATREPRLQREKLNAFHTYPSPPPPRYNVEASRRARGGGPISQSMNNIVAGGEGGRGEGVAMFRRQASL